MVTTAKEHQRELSLRAAANFDKDAYREKLLEAAQQCVETKLPDPLSKFIGALESYSAASLNGRQLDQETRVAMGELKTIKEKLDSIRRENISDEAGSIATLAKKLKYTSGLGNFSTELLSALAADSADEANEIIGSVGKAVSDQVSKLTESLEDAANQRLAILRIALKEIAQSGLFEQLQYKKSNLFADVEDAISGLNRAVDQGALEELDRCISQVKEEVTKIGSSFKDGLDKTTPLPRLRQILKDAGREEPSYKRNYGSLSLEGLSDREMLYQLQLSRIQAGDGRVSNRAKEQLSDLGDDTGKYNNWKQLLNDEVASWDEGRFLAATKAVIRVALTNPEIDPSNHHVDSAVCDLLKAEVITRLSLKAEYVDLAESLYDWTSNLREISREDLVQRELKRDLAQAGDLSEKKKIRCSVKGEFLSLLRKSGVETRADITSDVEAGKWAKPPKEKLLDLLKAALDKKIEDSVQRIQELRAARNRQPRSEDVFDRLFGAKDGAIQIEFNQSEFDETVKGLFAAGIFRARESNIDFISEKLDQLLNPKESQDDVDQIESAELSSNDVANEKAVSSGKDEKDSLERLMIEYLHQDFGCSEELIRGLVSSGRIQTVYERLEQAMGALKDGLTEELSDYSAEKAELQSLIGIIMRESAEALAAIEDDSRLMGFTSELAELISQVMAKSGSTAMASSDDLATFLRKVNLIPLSGSPEYEKHLKQAIKQVAQSRSSIEEPATDKEQPGQQQADPHPEEANGLLDMDKQLAQIVESVASRKITEFDGAKPQLIEDVAQIIHSGWYFAGSFYAGLEVQKIRRNAHLNKEGRRFKEAFAFLRRRGIANKATGRSFCLQVAGSPELKDFVIAIRALRAQRS